MPHITSEVLHFTIRKPSHEKSQNLCNRKTDLHEVFLRDAEWVCHVH